LIFITPTIIDAAGNRVHSDEDLPFARTNVPRQKAIKPTATMRLLNGNTSAPAKLAPAGEEESPQAIDGMTKPRVSGRMTGAGSRKSGTDFPKQADQGQFDGVAPMIDSIANDRETWVDPTGLF
jgi:hypothetical protein